MIIEEGIIISPFHRLLSFLVFVHGIHLHSFNSLYLPRYQPQTQKTNPHLESVQIYTIVTIHTYNETRKLEFQCPLRQGK